jgi:hypothetical protein
LVEFSQKCLQFFVEEGIRINRGLFHRYVRVKKRGKLTPTL